MSTIHGVGLFSRGLQFLRHPLHSLSKSNRVGQVTSPATQAPPKIDAKANQVSLSSTSEAEKLKTQLTVQGYLTEFLTAMQKVLPTTTEADRSVINALAGRADGPHSDPKERILDFFSRELHKYLQRPDGREFGFCVIGLISRYGISDKYRTPGIDTLLKQTYESLSDANLYGWFIEPLGPVAWDVNTTIMMWAPRG